MVESRWRIDELASEQIGLKAKIPGQGNGNQGGGEIYAIDSIKVVAEVSDFPSNPPLTTRLRCGIALALSSAARWHGLRSRS